MSFTASSNNGRQLLGTASRRLWGEKSCMVEQEAQELHHTTKHREARRRESLRYFLPKESKDFLGSFYYLYPPHYPISHSYSIFARHPSVPCPYRITGLATGTSQQFSHQSIPNKYPHIIEVPEKHTWYTLSVQKWNGGKASELQPYPHCSPKINYLFLFDGSLCRC